MEQRHSRRYWLPLCSTRPDRRGTIRCALRHVVAHGLSQLWLPVAPGATTLTEAWDANPDSSQNHFMLGHGEEWAYRGLAGISIDFDRPEAERISIRPYPVAGIESASATYRSVCGEIRVPGSETNDDLVLKIAVPPNSMATVEILLPRPTQFAKAIAPRIRIKAFSISVSLGARLGGFTFRFREL